MSDPSQLTDTERPLKVVMPNPTPFTEVTLQELEQKFPWLLYTAVTQVYVDCYEVNPNMRHLNVIRNHWTMILDCPKGQAQLSIKSCRVNERLEGAFCVDIKERSDCSRSSKVLQRETYSWKGPDSTNTVRDILKHTLTSGWHKYEMVRPHEQGLSGCRHHLKTMLVDFQEEGWIGTETDDGKTIDDYLPFLYEKRETRVPLELEEGKFYLETDQSSRSLSLILLASLVEFSSPISLV